MYKTLKHRFARYTAWVLVLSSLVTFTPVDVFAMKPVKVQDPQCKPGLTQKLTKKQLKQVQANPLNEKPKADVRTLSTSEMKGIRGSGQYRNAYFNGVMPWQRSFHDVNTSNGNLFKSFTDIQVAPARGAGLVLQRTYNSNDDRVGPFGVGWTHAYDTRMEDVGNNIVNNTDFFGAKHKYTRDADGLYTPPLYSHSVMSSEYSATLDDYGPIATSDKLVGLDGTVKHYIKDGADRVCDYIEDRHGNRTTLEYGLTATMSDGTTKNLLTEVTDPSGRTLTFTWNDIDPGPSTYAWRIIHVEGPSYGVTYNYYIGTGNVNKEYNLSSVQLDPTGLNRITEYDYTSCTGLNGTENGLLYSIKDPVTNASVRYAYTIPQDTRIGYIWVTQIQEPTGGNGCTWTLTPFIGESGTFIMYSTDVIVCRIQGPTQTPIVDIFAISDLYRRQLTYFLQDCSPVSGSTYYNDYNNTTITYYDPANNVHTRYTKHYSMYQGGLSVGVAAVNRQDNYTYGPHGHVLSHTTAGISGHSDSYVYSDENKYFQKLSVTDMEGRTSTFNYGTETDTNLGNRGNMLSACNSLNGQYTYTYNQYGQKTSETNPNNVVTEYTYGDAWGNLTKVVQDPGTGHLNRTTEMVYDESGRVIEKTDPNGRVSTVSYNVLGQPTEAYFPATNNTPAETITYGYDTNGRLLTVTDNRGTTTIGYVSGCDRVASVEDPVTGTILYSYTLMGSVAFKILPGGDRWDYTYSTNTSCMSKDDPNSITEKLVSITDDDGRLVEFDLDATGYLRTVKFNQTFDQNDVLVSYCMTEYILDGIPVDSNGVYGPATGTSRHLMNRIKNTWHWLENGTMQSRLISSNIYTFDNVGNRMTNEVTTSWDTGRIEAYGYDALYRLTSVNYGDGQNQSYTFDAVGNRLTKNDNQNETYVSNAANMMTMRNGQPYTYDTNGNTLSGGGRANIWDSQNRLRSCTYNGNTNLYTYGSDGSRRASETNNIRTDFILDGQNVVREMRDINSDGILESIATYFNGMYKRDDTNGTLRWYIYDGLGSVLAEVDPSGNVTAGRKYDVYGLVRSGQAGISKHKFVGKLGHLSEDETGLIYMRTRYMDPVLGKFMSEDPAYNGLNWYNYCNSNPINLVDINGKTADDLMLAYDELLAGEISGIGDWAWDEAITTMIDALRGEARDGALSMIAEMGGAASFILG
ncbi:RHS repeat-associated core domain-containing protein [uncultured Desulfobulbus sp.]|uniref:RHS repeat domain-containing protein n=1 Tax=uncultured Desulfobulbus sp. TaxID=239745 RepID=UPI0029C8B27B|nr:RHS repeat-associated core domain-containing protein [uncultured Desulfobulbus sp.]